MPEQELHTSPIAQKLAEIQLNGLHPPIAQQLPKSKKKGWIGISDKMLWGWLNLIAILLVPLMIGVFTISVSMQQNGLSQKQHDSDQKIAVDNRQHDLQIADDQQKEDILVNYQKEISDLLLNFKLGSSIKGDPVRMVARTKTLTALRQLNSE